jgi:PTS system mannose-specific IID component
MDGIMNNAAVDSKKKLTDKDIKDINLRSTFLLGSFNFERMQSMGFCVAMIPAIKRLYTRKEDQVAALKRHLEFFNTQPWVGSAVIGVTAAMEQERANGASIDDASISGVKVGLMGPLAGVGDPIFWGTARPVLAALGASLAISGSILGPLVFFFGINIARFLTRWYGLKYGYGKGTEIVKDMDGGRLQKLTQGASILGLFVMGSLVSKWTSMNVPYELSRYTNAAGVEVVTTVQSVLDQLLPGLLPLLLTFLCMKLLRKKVNPMHIIFALFAVGILGYWAGILA